MPRSPAYGIRASTAALGVLRQRSGDAMLAALRADATYAWYGGLGLADDGVWTDVIAGLVATSAARPSVGSLNGRRAASFDNQWLQTAAFASAIAQPFSIVSVSRLTAQTSTYMYVYDGIAASGRAMQYLKGTATSHVTIYQSNEITSAVSGLNVSAVTTARFNGASSNIVLNGTEIAAGNVGSTSMTGLTIGARYVPATSNLPFIGPIALVAICAGANDAARAARIAAVAREWYGI